MFARNWIPCCSFAAERDNEACHFAFTCAGASSQRYRALSDASQVEQEHLTSRNILLERLRAVRETQAAETQAQSSGSGEVAAVTQASDASTGTEVGIRPRSGISLARLLTSPLCSQHLLDRPCV